MGKKKPFIDKKNAVTYNLIYRSTEDVDDRPERLLVEAESQAGLGRPDPSASLETAHDAESTARRYPPNHPLAWLEEQDASTSSMSDDRRRELIELGFPDDGYDYLKHVRTLGRGTASLEGMQPPTGADEAASKPHVEERIDAHHASVAAAAAGPSVFLPAANVAPPEEDIALYDASALTVMQKAEDEAETEGTLGSISAFARPRDVQSGVDKRHRSDLEELEAAMADAEAESDDNDDDKFEGEDASGRQLAVTARRGSGGGDLSDGGDVKGHGDLLDDFVLAATAAVRHGGEDVVGEVEVGSDVEEGWSSEQEEYDEEEAWSGDGDERRSHPRAGSIASTYWRAERSDRRKLLGVIDEHFEHLALEYDEDEIGDMEERAEAGEIAGIADVEQFDAMLNEFLQLRRFSQAATAAGGDVVIFAEDAADEGESSEQAGNGKATGLSQTASKLSSQLKEQLEAAGFDDDDAATAVEAARAAIRKAEMEEEQGVHTSIEGVWTEESAPRERWDCESVLSLRSNIYNHPGTIAEPLRQKSRPPRTIRLNKAGIPMGFLPTSSRKAYKRYELDNDDVEEEETNKDIDADEDYDAEQEPQDGVAVPTERRKDETAEEKRARKAAVKAAKREARVSKKELKLLYKQENVKAQKRAATAQVQPSLIL